MTKELLIRIIGQQLEEASVSDLLIEAVDGESMIYDVDIVKKIVGEFLRQDCCCETESANDSDKVREIRFPGILSDASKVIAAKLIDGYLAEIARDSKLPVSKFVELAEMVSTISGLLTMRYTGQLTCFSRSIRGITKSERKRICKLMDCKKLSVDACMHALQNERPPLREVVQVLFVEHVRVAATSGSSTPDLPRSLRDLKNGSYGSSRSAATNPEEDWDDVATADELCALKAEMALLMLSNVGDVKHGIDRSASNKIKGLTKMKIKKIFAKLWIRKGGKGENSGSDSSDSLGSANPEEAMSTPSRNRRHSVS